MIAVCAAVEKDVDESRVADIPKFVIVEALLQVIEVEYHSAVILYAPTETAPEGAETGDICRFALIIIPSDGMLGNANFTYAIVLEAIRRVEEES